MVKKEKTLMKKYKNYIILGVIIIALIAGVIIISGIDTPSEQPENTQAELITVYSLDKEDVLSVNITNEYGKYTVKYGDSIVVEGKDIEKDDEKLKYLLTEISSMYAEDTVPYEDKSLSQFGLDIPVATLDIALINGELRNLYVGNETPSGSGRYVKYMNEKKVYIVNSYSLNSILRKLDYYRNTDLFSVDIPSVTDLSFEKNGKKVSFKKNTQDKNPNTFAAFSMITPYNWDADASEIEKVLNHLNELQISEYVEDNLSDLSKYGIGNGKITVRENSGKVSILNFGSNKDGKLYVTAGDKKDVYLVNGAGFEFMDYEPTAFLQQFVLLRAIDNVANLRYTHNDIDASFDIKKVDVETHDVKYKGKLIDQKRFKALYTEIISMTTAGTVNYTPSGEPILEYTFTYLDGSKETVKYYRYDERKIAVSINNLVYFYVDSSQFKNRVEKVDNIINNEF